MGKKQIAMTRQRRAILDALCGVVTHPTADDLHRMVREKMPHISLGTVYRNLETMAECGLVMKLNTAGQQMRFDGNTVSHYHIRCNKCGRVDDVAIDLLDTLERAAGEASGYVVSSHSIEFEGTCPECVSSSDTGND